MMTVFGKRTLGVVLALALTVAPALAAKPQVPAPLTGTVTTGTWVTNQLLTGSFGTSPGGYSGMRYNYLLPSGYDPSSYVYPLMFIGGGNDQGMNGSTYPRDGGTFVSSIEAEGFTYNTVAFRTAHPAIIVAPECDQTLDSSGANGNANCGGYNDTANSGWNEQAISAVAKYMIANFSVDSTRVYAVGLSLSAIGYLANLVDNNAVTPSGTGVWTAAVGMSEQLYRPTVSNSTYYTAMESVPYLAISTPSDNNPASWDEPFWTHITGTTAYPTKSDYDTNGMSGIRAGTTSYYYINTPSGAPWSTFGPSNSDGGDGTTWQAWLFSQSTGSIPSTCTPTTNNTVVTSGTLASITDVACNIWTVPSASGAIFLNSQSVSGTSNVAKLVYVNGVVWQQASGSWSYLTPTSNGSTAVAGPSFSLSPLQTNWWTNPGQDGYYNKLPFQTTASWSTSTSGITALRNGVSSGHPIASVNLPGNYSIPFYTATATDPTVTVQLGATSFRTHLPLGAVVEAPFIATDSSIGGTDQSQPGLTWALNGVSMTVNGSSVSSVQASGTVLTGTYGLNKDWGYGPFMVDALTGQLGTGNPYEIIQDAELTRANADSSYVIPHMINVQLDDSQVNKSIVWPLNAADGSFNFVGPLPQGLTVGIPASTPRPTGMTRGQSLMFDTFQQMGGLVYNFGATGGGMNFQIYSKASANATLLTDIVNNAITGGGPGGSSWLMQYMSYLDPTKQTGISSQKGEVAGVRSDAFPPPPLLSLQPTGGVEVSSSTAGTYYPTTNTAYSSASGGYTAPAPLLVGPATLSVALSTPTAVPGLSAHEIWYPNDSLTLTAHSSGSGTLTATGASGNGTGTITATGGVSTLNSLLSTVKFSDGVPENPILYFTVTDAHNEIWTITTAITSGNTCPASVNNSTLSGGTSGVLTDSNSNAWGLPKSGGMVFLNGTALPWTTAATQLAFVSNVIWYENSSNQWFSFNTVGGIASGPTVSPLQITITAPASFSVVQGISKALTGVSANDAANPSDTQSFSGSSTGSGTLSATGAVGNGTGTITFSGSLSALNTALGTLLFQDPVAENPTVSYSVSDGHALSASTTTAVTVTGNAPPPTSGTTWSSTAKGTGATLTNNNSTMTTSTGGANVLSTSSKSSGKACFTVTAGTLTYNWAAGLATAGQALNGSYLGGTGSPSEAIYMSYGGQQTIFNAGTTAANIAAANAPSASGDVMLEAVDFDSGLFWHTDAAMRGAGYAWNDSTTATPVGEVGGLSLSALGVGPYFMAAGAQEGGSVFTLNPMPSGCPTGFSTWDQPVAAGHSTTVITVN